MSDTFQHKPLPVDYPDIQPALECLIAQASRVEDLLEEQERLFRQGA